MDAIDMRSLSSDARHARRLQVIRLRSAGVSYKNIALETGLSRTGVFDICKRHDPDDLATLRDKPNGRKTGHGRMLLPAQELLVCTWIAEHTPDQYGLGARLWTPEGVAQLIAQRLGILLQRRAMRLCLARWGYVQHAHMERSSACAAPALRRWLGCDLPAIEMRARLEAAEIHWAHEGALTGADRDTATPLPLQASVLSTVTNRGSRFWMSLHGPLDAATSVDFLLRLTQGREHKVFLMLDRMHVHQAADIAVWLAEHDQVVEVFCLPDQADVQVRPDRSNGGLLPFSPELAGDS